MKSFVKNFEKFKFSVSQKGFFLFFLVRDVCEKPSTQTFGNPKNIKVIKKQHYSLTVIFLIKNEIVVKKVFP